MASKPKKETAVTKQPSANLAVDFASDAGMGLEGADKASFAIPFLIVLQSNSPQIETVAGAKAGMFMNSVTNELFTEARVVPVAFQRRYLAWAPREQGGGFRGDYPVAKVEGAATPLGWKRDDKGGMVMPDGSVLKDTREHFILLLTQNGPQQAMLSLSSTQIKKSKKWLSRIQSITMKDANGRAFNPPSFSHTYKLTTVTEENDKGKWKGVEIELEGPVAEQDTYAMAKHFHSMIVAGKVEVAAPPAQGEGEGDEAF